MVFNNRLQYRIILLVFIILLVMGVTGDGVILYFQRQTTIANFTDSTVMLATTLRDSLERDMLLVDRQHIQQTVDQMSSAKPVSAITIVSNENKVFAASDPSTIGTSNQNDEIRRVFASGETVTRIEKQSNNRSIYVVFPVLNKPICYDCHGTGEQILGAIEVGVDAQLLNSQLRKQTLTMVFIAGTTFLLIGGALAYMFRSSVIKPISKLIESARRIAGGDLTARVHVDRNDEVGSLARSFNEMAEQVERNATALENSKVILEETVQERTRQLQETAGIRGQLLERLISAQEEERHRVARELHDEAGQALSAIMMDLSRAIDSLPDAATEAKKRLSQSRALAQQTLGDLRKLIYDLRPEVLDQLGLGPALRSYVKSRLEDKNIRVKLTLSGMDKRLPQRLETTVFRVIQEASTNVVRHSSASTVTIKVAVTNSKVNASIEDDGQGFNVDKALHAPESWGLRGIRERIGVVSGQLTIKSENGKGTLIEFIIPLEGEQYG